MKKFKVVLALLTSTILFTSFSACSNGNTQQNQSNNGDIIVETQDFSIELEETFNGRKLSTVPDEIQQYLNAEDELTQLKLLKKYSDLPFYKNSIMFSWIGDSSKNYTVHFATNQSFSNEITFTTHKQYLFDSAKFIPGMKYFWKVTGDKDENSSSKVDSFVYSDEPVRIISFDGGHNIRDLGGWKTTDGKKVKFGKLIRGGRINGIGEEGIAVLKDDLGIKTEMDLRGEYDDGGQKTCIFDSKATYMKLNLGQYCYILPNFLQTEPNPRAYDDETPEKIKKIFTCLSYENNYPVYFHCNAGADRTGTLAFLINGVLGVPYEDLLRDFELTSFSSSGRRWRGLITDEFEVSSDVMQDDSGNYVAFNKMYNMMMENYGEEGGSLQSAIENYLKTVCGVTDEEISKLKSIMLS